MQRVQRVRFQDDEDEDEVWFGDFSARFVTTVNSANFYQGVSVNFHHSFPYQPEGYSIAVTRLCFQSRFELVPLYRRVNPPVLTFSILSSLVRSEVDHERMLSMIDFIYQPAVRQFVIPLHRTYFVMNVEPRLPQQMEFYLDTAEMMDLPYIIPFDLTVEFEIKPIF